MSRESIFLTVVVTLVALVWFSTYHVWVWYALAIVIGGAVYVGFGWTGLFIWAAVVLLSELFTVPLRRQIETANEEQEVRHE